MEQAPGARSFLTSGDSYDSFMGRYSRRLAGPFADAAGITAGQFVLDVGCGPGALTEELVRRVGASKVHACDPSPPFVAECRSRFPGVDVRIARMEELPDASDTYDAVLAQLVMHFVSDEHAAARELRRVVRPGGVIAACVWDFAEGMEMLRQFWDAAVAVDTDAPDEGNTLRFGRPGELAELFLAADLRDVRETNLVVSSHYRGFDELWAGFLAGIGPAGAYLVSVDADRQHAIHDELFRRLGEPQAGFDLRAMARCTTARRLEV